MHRRPETKLLPLDTELERTLRNLKKARIDEAIAMAEQEGTDQHIPAEQQHKGLTYRGPWKTFGG